MDDVNALSTGVAELAEAGTSRIINGDVLIHDTAFPTQEEAKDVAQALAHALLEHYRNEGAIAYRTDHQTGEIIE
jgi:hypothetical protein